MDVLALLRDFAREALEVTEDNDDLLLGETRFSKQTSVTGVKANKSFELQELWCFLKNGQHLPGKAILAYRRDARERKIPVIKVLDAQAVRDFFTADPGRAVTSSNPVDDQAAPLAPIVLIEDGPKECVASTEKLIRTANSVLLGPCDFKSRVFQLIDDLKKGDKERRPSQRPRGPDYQRDRAWMERRKDPNTTDLGIDETGSNMKKSHHSSSKSHKSGQPQGAMPILVVPNGRSATLNMFNVKQFLQDGMYTEVQAAMKLKPHKEQKIFVKSAKFVNDPNFPPMFEVVDSIKGLRDKDWARVAGVVVQGPEWQFKGWRWKDPAAIMNNVTGFHLCYDNVDKHPNAIAWQVQILEVTRHNDER